MLERKEAISDFFKFHPGRKYGNPYSVQSNTIRSLQFWKEMHRAFECLTPSNLAKTSPSCMAAFTKIPRPKFDPTAWFCPTESKEVTAFLQIKLQILSSLLQLLGMQRSVQNAGLDTLWHFWLRRQTIICYSIIDLGRWMHPGLVGLDGNGLSPSLRQFEDKVWPPKRWSGRS